MNEVIIINDVTGEFVLTANIARVAPANGFGSSITLVREYSSFEIVSPLSPFQLYYRMSGKVDSQGRPFPS